MTEARFELREVFCDDPRFLRREAFDTKYQCKVMLEQPGPALGPSRGTETDALALQLAEEDQRFLRGALKLARVVHDRVVRLREVVDVAGVPTLVLDLPKGAPLSDLLADGKQLSPERVIAIGLDIAAAAAAVHDEGVVHRGIAPENIFVDADGRAALAGFTFAMNDGPGGALTSLMHRAPTPDGRAAAGLPTYAAPEQLEGKKADHRADVFALGCVLYRALTGVDAQPSPGQEDIVPPRQLASSCPPALEALVLDSLAHNPRSRCSSMPKVTERLHAILQRREQKRPPAIKTMAVGAALAAIPLVTVLVLPALGGDTLYGRPLAPTPADFRDNGYLPKYEKSHALVIGCNYKDNLEGLRVLRNAENDAKSVATVLGAIGFDSVVPLIGPDANRARIEAELNVLAAAGRDDRVLIYFAGHGDRHVDGSLFLLPADAGSGKSRQNWVSFGTVRPVLRSPTGPKHVLLLLDCCHSGAAQRGPGVDRGPDIDEGEDCLPKNYQDTVTLCSRARWIVTAAMDAEAAADGKADHSPFAIGLLAALEKAKTRSVPLFEVYGSIADAVKASGARQKPWIRDVEGSHTSAEFLFWKAPDQPAPQAAAK